MDWKVWGVTPKGIVAVLAIIAVMAAILFPVFQKVQFPPNGIVRDSSGKPIPNAVLRFRDPAGRLIATITADDSGQFRRKRLDILSKNAVDGFGLTRANHRTGSPDLYTFTPLGTQIATFRDEAGKPVAGLTVSFSPDPHTWQHGAEYPAFNKVTDKKGAAHLTNIPSGARLLIVCDAPRYFLKQIDTTVSANTINYTITVAKPVMESAPDIRKATQP